MATRAITITPLPYSQSQGWAVQWTGLANGDDGTPYEGVGSTDRSVQVTGTFGTGGSVRLEGSNDGTNYAALTDPQGNDLNITSAKIEAITELCRYIRPRVTAGDGTTSLVVTVVAFGPVKG